MTTDYKGTATYSPEDNKLRMTPFARLSKDDYNTIRASGFIWAPKQEFFVAPMWTPEREDLLLQWCGEIDDEDKSLVERAEERAERFEDYSDKRKADADSAHKAVESICEHIPLGQPILVGHHSERKARKAAKRIENRMRMAVKMWETSQYWKDRATSAIRHAKYKEEPDVRARRIKRIEADKRKQERAKAEAESLIRLWQGKYNLVNKTTGEKRPLEITEANRATLCEQFGRMRSSGVSIRGIDGQNWYSAWDILRPDDERSKNCPVKTVAELKEIALRLQSGVLERCNRWIAHYDNRLTYERAMLADGGGLVAAQFALAVGGQVLRRGKWLIITKLNGGTMGKPESVSIIGHFASTIPIEDIEDYRPPKEGDFEKVKAVMTKPPLCNYPGDEIMLQNRYHPNEPEKARFATITQAEWDKVPSDYKGTMQIVLPSQTAGRHRVRICLGVYCKLPPPTGKELESSYCSANRTHRYWPVYITDRKRIDPPEPDGKNSPVLPVRESVPVTVYRPREKNDEQAKFDALREQVKAGVQVVSTPQLFPTPPELARRMAETADLKDGVCVLEPSAGTGNLVQAIKDIVDTEIVGIEINRELCNQLQRRFSSFVLNVRCADFLQCNEELGQFERILMNPPFANGSDIAHIKHAIEHLSEGGKLVALCANGPQQERELQPLTDSWEPLPKGTFKEQGTNVSVVLLTIGK